MGKIALVYLALSSTIIGYSQPVLDTLSLQLQKTTRIESNIKRISIDKYRNIYVCDGQNAVLKVDSMGTIKDIYSPKKPGQITLIEAWHTIGIFLFYTEFQEYVFLDRFVTEKHIGKVDPETCGFARLATPSIDNNIWMIDDQSFSLIKTDIQQSTNLLHIPLSQILPHYQYNFTHMREYQNRLYLFDPTHGIFVFDNLGNYLTNLQQINGMVAGFKDEYIYQLNGNTLFFQHLYTFEIVKKIIPLKTTAKQLIISKNELIVCTDKEILFYTVSGL